MIFKSSEERPGLCVPELPIGTSCCYLAFHFIAEAVRNKMKQLHQDFSEVKVSTLQGEKEVFFLSSYYLIAITVATTKVPMHTS